MALLPRRRQVVGAAAAVPAERDLQRQQPRQLVAGVVLLRGDGDHADLGAVVGVHAEHRARELAVAVLPRVGRGELAVRWRPSARIESADLVRELSARAVRALDVLQEVRPGAVGLLARELGFIFTPAAEA